MSDDIIRSLVISHTRVPGEGFVIHHTNCRMEFFSNEVMSELLKNSLKTASVDAESWLNSGESPSLAEGKYINWLTIKNQTISIIVCEQN